MGTEDYCYESTMPLLDGGVGREEGTAVHEQDLGMQEVRGLAVAGSQSAG